MAHFGSKKNTAIKDQVQDDKQGIQIEIEDDELLSIQEEKESARNYRERRHSDWNELPADPSTRVTG